jgi:hypothetical protein
MGTPLKVSPRRKDPDKCVSGRHQWIPEQKQCEECRRLSHQNFNSKNRNRKTQPIELHAEVIDLSDMPSRDASIEPGTWPRMLRHLSLLPRGKALKIDMTGVNFYTITACFQHCRIACAYRLRDGFLYLYGPRPLAARKAMRSST